MNRRSFLTKSALALFGFTVLPPAKTYERIWKARTTLLTQPVLVNPAYETTLYEAVQIYGPNSGKIIFRRDDPPEHIVRQRLEKFIIEPFPERFVRVPGDRLVIVPPFI
jgi:hypothetical protein